MEIYHNDAVKVWQISKEAICLVLSHYLCCFFIKGFSGKKLKFIFKINSAISLLVYLYMYSFCAKMDS